MTNKEIGNYAFKARTKLTEINLKGGKKLVGRFGANQLNNELYKNNDWKFLITALEKEIQVNGDEMELINETEKVFL